MRPRAGGIVIVIGSRLLVEASDAFCRRLIAGECCALAELLGDRRRRAAICSTDRELELWGLGWCRPRAITSTNRALRRAWTGNRLPGSLRFPASVTYRPDYATARPL